MATSLPIRISRSHVQRQLPWITVLAIGSAIYAALLFAVVGNGDIIFVPSLLLIGAAVVPATFTTFVSGLAGGQGPPVALVAGVAAVGGLIGAVMAGALEVQTMSTTGSLPSLAVGVIEESTKLAVPALILIWRRPRPLDGIVLGVAVGSGFAALETMGYGFVALVRSGGQLDTVTQLLLMRAIAAPGGHAAWTGLTCAALFAVRGSRRPGLAWLRFLFVFAGAVVAHTSWDNLTSSYGYFLIGGGSFIVLMVVTWYLRRHASETPAISSRTTGWTPVRGSLPERRYRHDAPYPRWPQPATRNATGGRTGVFSDAVIRQPHQQ